MYVDDIADQYAMGFNRSPVPEGIVFLCASALGVLSVIPLEVRGWDSRMFIVLPRGCMTIITRSKRGSRCPGPMGRSRAISIASKC